MKKMEWNRVLPYIGLLVLGISLLVLKRNEIEAHELLLRELLLIFGYLASLGDIREKKVTNGLVTIMAGAWVLAMLPQLILQTERTLSLLLSSVAGFVLGGTVFLVVYLVSRKGLGGGDVKLMAVSGLYLEFSKVLPAMLYGSVLAALTGIVLILMKKVGPKDAIPLVPFLYVGMLLTMFIR